LPQSVGVAPSHENPVSQLVALDPQVSTQGTPSAHAKEQDVASHSIAHVMSLPLQSSAQLEVAEEQTTLVLLLNASTVHEPLAEH